MAGVDDYLSQFVAPSGGAVVNAPVMAPTVADPAVLAQITGAASDPTQALMTNLSMQRENSLTGNNQIINDFNTLSAWDFAKQIMPLLAIGVVIAGFLLGSTHDETRLAGVIPAGWISTLVGGNSLFSNFFASVVGAFMYFATLTEVPIVQGLMAAGMGKGPALALLLAGPALSLPNMLVIRGIMGTQKTILYVSLVVIMATLTGCIYGFLF